MKNWNTSILFMISLLFAGCNSEELIPVSIQCSTGDATEITTESATLRGTAVVQHAKEESGQAYFYYSTTAADSESMKASGYRVSAGSITAEGGFFSTTLSGLNEGNMYYYMASASIGGVEEHGDIKSFITVSKPKEVSVTSDATNITETTAVLSGYANLTNDLKEPAFGIMWSTNQNPSVENGYGDISIEIDSHNKYFVTARGLKPATNYYYKAFVKDGNFLKVGEVRTFTTLDFSAKATTEEVTNITLYSATLQGELKVDSIDNLEKSVWFVYSDTYSSPEELYNSGTKVSSYLDGSDRFTKDIQSLKRGTKYYYMACARVHERIYQGEVRSFDTNSISASIATESAVNCSVFAATLQGKISIDNNESLSVNAGFYYSKQAKTITELINTGSHVIAQKGSGNTYSASIQSLESGTEYYYVFIASIDGQQFNGNVKSFSTTNINATIQTENASSIGLYTATLNASLVVTNSESLSSTVCFYYSSDYQTQNDLITKGLSINGEKNNDDYIAIISSLKRATKYYVIAIATVGDRTFVGSVVSFCTDDIQAKLSAKSVYDIEPFKVKLTASLSISNTEPLQPAVYVYYSTQDSNLEDLVTKGTMQQLQREDGGLFVQLTNLQEASQYYYVFRTIIDGKEFVSDIGSFKTITIQRSGAANLGLSVQWATCNVGAQTPEQSGDYFSWAETTPKDKTKYNVSWYKYIGHGGAGSWYVSKYTSRSGYSDNLTVLEPSDDAATINMGEGWRTPTVEEWQELLNRCIWSNTGAYWVITGNSTAIILPLCGEYNRDPSTGGSKFSGTNTGVYWTANVYQAYDSYSNGWSYARTVTGDKWSEKPTVFFLERWFGVPVRAVK